MLKPFDELVKLDISGQCLKRDGAAYLPWAKCYQLLHENGATVVYHEPLVDERTGSTLFMSDKEFGDFTNGANRCYEVRVKITIDDLVFVANYPVINGVNPVRDNSMSQLRVSNAHQRAFVKGVAMRTGLGFSLWIDDDSDIPENLSVHNIMSIKRRVEQLITAKMQGGMSQDDIRRKLGMSYKELQQRLDAYAKLDAFEKALAKI